MSWLQKFCIAYFVFFACHFLLHILSSIAQNVNVWLTKHPSEQWFSKWAESPLGGDFDGQGGEKNKGDDGAKQHQGGENAQPLIDQLVNFSSLLLRLVSFLQVLIYCDNRWRLMLKQCICKIFPCICPTAVWIISGLRSRRKNDAAPAPELFFSWTWPQLRSSCVSWVWLRIRSSVFHGSGSCVCFHTLPLSWCASNWIENELNQVHITTRI